MTVERDVDPLGLHAFFGLRNLGEGSLVLLALCAEQAPRTTAGTVTSAAVVMVGVFSIFATLPTST